MLHCIIAKLCTFLSEKYKSNKYQAMGQINEFSEFCLALDPLAGLHQYKLNSFGFFGEIFIDK